MKTNQQIKIDELVIRPLVSVLNILVKLVGKVFRINHELIGVNFDTIAVCKYKGMGSIIQATPLLQTLKANYPKAKIVFITTPGNIGIIKKTGLVDEIVCLDDSSFFSLIKSFPGFIIRLIKLKIGVYIDLEVHSNFSTLITILSMAKNRMGFYLQSKHYRLGNYTHMMYHNTRSPIMETYLQFARLLCCEIKTTELIALTSDSNQIRFDDKDWDLNKFNYLVINPNASDLRLERRWGKENYHELIGLLLNHFSDYYLFIIGGKREQLYINEVLTDIVSDKVINTTGKTNLEQLIALIEHAHLVITNDSGPMHIAFATKTPTIALFGPCSPHQYGNHGNSLSIYKNAYCSPCVHDFVNPPCRGNNICMKLISVEEVFQAIISTLTKSTMVPYPQTGIVYEKDSLVLGALDRKKHVTQ